ncbi:MAG: ribonuclease PH, partial [Pusillimonas sp.]
SLTGAWVAAALAMRGLVDAGVLQRSPLLDQVAAVSVGLVDGRAVLDLDYIEDSGCGADMNIVMTGAGHFVEVQGTAEGQTFERKALDTLLDLAQGGIQQLLAAQKSALG